MDGKFLKGVFVGSLIGMVMIKHWDEIKRRCSVLHELKGSALFDEDGQPMQKEKVHRYKPYARKSSHEYSKSRDL